MLAAQAPTKDEDRIYINNNNSYKQGDDFINLIEFVLEGSFVLPPGSADDDATLPLYLDVRPHYFPYKPVINPPISPLRPACCSPKTFSIRKFFV